MYNVEWWDDEEGCYVDQNFHDLDEALDCAARRNSVVVDEEGTEYWG